jgi:UDP-N-acetylglucosamine transferase subunit ALG13
MKVLVLFGSIKNRFYTLEDWLKNISKHEPNEYVVQAGASFEYLSNLKPLNCTLFDYMSVELLENHFQTADIVVSHAGTGSCFTSLKYGKVPYVAARLHKLNEHVDNHQVELRDYLVGKNLAKDIISRHLEPLDIPPMDVSGKELTEKLWKIIDSE